MHLKNLKMKHYAMMLAALVAGVLLFTECASMRIPYRRLPAGAKAFIGTYFPTESCVYAERDRDDGRREDEVKRSNGTDIDFPASCRRLLSTTLPSASPEQGFRRPSANAAAISSRWAAERR